MSDRQIDVKVGAGVNSTAKDISQALQTEAERDELFINSYKDKDKATLTKEEIELFGAVKKRDTERKKRAYKQRVARVLDRGFTVDRLTVPIPVEDELWGEWIPNHPSDLARADLLGFKTDTKYAIGRALHDGGDGSAMVGDVIFMVQPMWMHEAIVEERDQRYADAHLTKKQKEERDFLLNTEKEGVPASANSLAETLPGPALTERMETNKSVVTANS